MFHMYIGVKKKDQSVVQAYGNSAHRDGQWLIPCDKDMRSYKEADEDAGTD